MGINNLFKFEEHLRLALGLLLAGYAIHSQIWLILPFGLLLVFTANIKYCPIYHLLGIRY